MLEQSHEYKRPTVSLFLNFKGAFDSVDRPVLLNTLVQQCRPLKFVDITRSFYSQTQSCVIVYEELSRSFPTGSGVCQGCHLSPFLFNLVIDAVMKRTLEDLQNPSVQTMAGENLVDLDYADNIVLLFEKEEAQVVLNRLSGIIPSFGLRFAPSKCKVMLQDVQNLRAPLKI